jgi:hypothetical protein
VRIQAKKPGQYAVTAAAEFEGLQAGVQTALLFIQEAVEQNQGRLGFGRGNLQAGSIGNGGDGFGAAACQPLPLAGRGVLGSVEVKTRDEFARDLPLPHQLPQHVLRFDM